MTNEVKAVCCCCGEALSPAKFNKCNSNFYISGHLPICKTCFKEKFSQYAVEYNSKKKAMQRMCMAFDLYYDESLFEGCNKENSPNEKIVGDYFRKINLKQCEGKTFDTSLEVGFEFTGDRSIVEKPRVALVDKYGNEVQGDEVNGKDVQKWGAGFSPKDYSTLNEHYNYLKKANPNCDSNQEIFILDLCYIKMQQLNAVQEGRVDDYKKLSDTYIKSFAQAGLKTKQDEMQTADDAWSLWCNIVSEYSPEEYYKDKKRFCDYDGFGEYQERNVVRPFKNIVLGTNDRDKEFFVHDGDDDE